MARFTHIGVAGFKSIKDLKQLELRPVNILIGPNGAGKSNLISFLDLLRRIADGTLQAYVGRAGGDDYEDPWKQVEEMERLLDEDVQDRRFIPYLQLYEFEALILTDARCLAKFYPNRRDEILRLAESIKKQFKSPEEVNRMTPPSWRIRTVVPEYEKPLFGISAVMDLGIERIRAECKHFDSWLLRLESLF